MVWLLLRDSKWLRFCFALGMDSRFNWRFFLLFVGAGFTTGFLPGRAIAAPGFSGKAGVSYPRPGNVVRVIQEGEKVRISENTLLDFQSKEFRNFLVRNRILLDLRLRGQLYNFVKQKFFLLNAQTNYLQSSITLPNGVIEIYLGRRVVGEKVIINVQIRNFRNAELDLQELLVRELLAGIMMAAKTKFDSEKMIQAELIISQDSETDILFEPGASYTVVVFEKNRFQD